MTIVSDIMYQGKAPKPRLLLIDDNEVDLIVRGSMLEQLGFDVHTALITKLPGSQSQYSGDKQYTIGNLAELKRVLDTAQPDAVLTDRDWKNPMIRNGYDLITLAKAIRPAAVYAMNTSDSTLPETGHVRVETGFGFVKKEENIQLIADYLHQQIAQRARGNGPA